MKCVVVSVNNTKKKGLRKRKILFRRLNMCDCGCDVVILPYTDEEISRIGERRFYRLMKKINTELKGNIICAYNNERIEKYITDNNIDVADGRYIILEMLDLLVRRCAKNKGLSLEKTTVGIYAQRADGYVYSAMNKLSVCCERLLLCFEDYNDAYTLAERLLIETGTPTDIITDLSEFKSGILCVFGKCRAKPDENVTVIDVYGCNDFGIKELRFGVPWKYEEFFKLVNKPATQSTLDFIVEMGGELCIGEDIRLQDYR